MPKVELKPPGVPVHQKKKQKGTNGIFGLSWAWGVTGIATAALAIWMIPFLQQAVLKWANKPDVEDSPFFSDKKSIPKRTPLLKVSNTTVPEIDWDAARIEDMAMSIVQDAVPIIMKKIPKKLFALFEVDLIELAQRGFYLNASKWQNQPVFTASHERERGGMIGNKNDKHTLYSNVTMADFLRSLMNPNSYLSWYYCRYTQ